MTKERVELNKFIHTHKDLFDSCWHEWEDTTIKHRRWGTLDACKCKNSRCQYYKKPVPHYTRLPKRSDYTSKEMFLTVWEKVKGKDWFIDFIIWYDIKMNNEQIYYKKSYYNDLSFGANSIIHLINSQRLCELIRDFLINREEK